jgi:hypothetical protein
MEEALAEEAERSGVQRGEAQEGGDAGEAGPKPAERARIDEPGGLHRREPIRGRADERPGEAGGGARLRAGLRQLERGEEPFFERRQSRLQPPRRGQPRQGPQEGQGDEDERRHRRDRKDAGGDQEPRPRGEDELPVQRQGPEEEDG